MSYRVKRAREFRVVNEEVLVRCPSGRCATVGDLIVLPRGATLSQIEAAAGEHMRTKHEGEG